MQLGRYPQSAAAFSPNAVGDDAGRRGIDLPENRGVIAVIAHSGPAHPDRAMWKPGPVAQGVLLRSS
jgi:hypothetical protein